MRRAFFLTCQQLRLRGLDCGVSDNLGVFTGMLCRKGHSILVGRRGWFFCFVVICGQTSVFFLSRVGVCLLARGVTREVVIHHTLLTTTTTSLLQYYYFFFSSFFLHSRSGRREKNGNESCCWRFAEWLRDEGGGEGCKLEFDVFLQNE